MTLLRLSVKMEVTLATTFEGLANLSWTILVKSGAARLGLWW